MTFEQVTGAIFAVLLAVDLLIGSWLLNKTKRG